MTARTRLLYLKQNSEIRGDNTKLQSIQLISPQAQKTGVDNSWSSSQY